MSTYYFLCPPWKENSEQIKNRDRIAVICNESRWLELPLAQIEKIVKLGYTIHDGSDVEIPFDSFKTIFR